MSRALIIATVLAALGLFDARAGAADSAVDGWAAYQAQHFVEAVRLWTPRAQAGDPEAAFGLGLAYDLGQGVAADPSAACMWYSRGGAEGQVSAMFNVAVLYDSGRCGPRRADLAALWYGRAAASGHARAQFDLGQLYAAGDGVPRNPDQAAAWYRAALASGIAAAADRINPPGRPARTSAAAQGSLLAVIPVSPDDRRDGGDGEGTASGPTAATPAVALVWDAPEQPNPVHFFVEVVALAPEGIRAVLTRYVDVSALLVRLPPEPGAYAWRVLTVDAATPHYVVAPWRHFTLAAQP